MSGTRQDPDGQGAAAPGSGPARKQHLRLTPDVWRQVRHLYEDEGRGSAELAERFGVTRATVERRVRAESWVRQEQLRALMESGDTRGLARMVARLIAAFEAQVRAVEVQFQDAAGHDGMAPAFDPAAVERNARTLGSLAKTLDILIELRGGLSTEDEGAERDADVLRRDLEKRLERLCRKTPVAAIPSRPRSGRAGVPAP